MANLATLNNSQVRRKERLDAEKQYVEQHRCRSPTDGRGGWLIGWLVGWLGRFLGWVGVGVGVVD